MIFFAWLVDNKVDPKKPKKQKTKGELILGKSWRAFVRGIRRRTENQAIIEWFQNHLPVQQETKGPFKNKRNTAGYPYMYDAN